MTEEEARIWLEGRADGAGLARLDRLVAMLREEAGRQNLVSASTLDAVWVRHVVDSAQLLDLAPNEMSNWLDIGTGAGFPGMVIAALRPELPVMLVEPRRRRVEWLNTLADALGLSRVRVECAKIERQQPFPAAVISARAVAWLPDLLQSAAAFSTPDTTWLLPKGASAAQELTVLPAPIRGMFHVEQSVTDPAARIIVGKGRIETGRSNIR